MVVLVTFAVCTAGTPTEGGEVWLLDDGMSLEDRAYSQHLASIVLVLWWSHLVCSEGLAQWLASAEQWLSVLRLIAGAEHFVCCHCQISLIL